MLTIGKIPQKVKRFFQPVQRQVSEHVFAYFWEFVLAFSVSHGHTIERLMDCLRDTSHRTNHGEFLWRSQWDEAWALRAIALDTLKRLYRKDCPDCYLILDDTQTIKRAKKMQAVGKLYHHANKTYCTGHTILKACLFYRGVTLPWGNWLYVKKEQAQRLQVPFEKLTNLAAGAIRQAQFPPELRITVLFDSWYLCPQVVQACQERRWHYISVAKKNRTLMVPGVGKKAVGTYGRNVLKNSGHSCSITGLRKSLHYRIAERRGHMSKLGEVRVIFSQRRNESQFVTLVTNHFNRALHKLVADYLKRWSIEMLIKDEKQHLGLGDYRVLRYQAIVRHLSLVDCAYACLTHVGLNDQHAQGYLHTKPVLFLNPISKLKEQMRQIVWQEEVKNVIKVSHERKVVSRLEKLLNAS